MVLWSGWFADFLRARCLPTVVVRKAFTFIGQTQRLFVCMFVCLFVLEHIFNVWNQNQDAHKFLVELPAAFTGGAMTLLLCGYLGTSTLTAVTFLTLSNAVSELVVAGAAANTLDIAPRFAGVINGITSVGNALPGVVGPQVATAIATQVGFITSICSMKPLTATEDCSISNIDFDIIAFCLSSKAKCSQGLYSIPGWLQR